MFYALSKVLWFVVTPSNLLIGLALAGTAGASFGRPRLARLGLGLSAGAIVAIALCGILPVGTWLLAPLENRFPVPAETGRPVHGIIVLGGAVRPALSFARKQIVLNDAAERVVAMADLARREPAARIVFSGGSGTLLGDDIPEADAVARFAGTFGIDPARILYENRSRTTGENALETRALVSPAPGERWLLVTSAWHMPRAVGAFRQVGFDVSAYPVDYRTGAGDGVWPEPALGAGLDRLDLAVREWVGLAAYRVSGRTDAVFPGPSSSEAGPIR